MNTGCFKCDKAQWDADGCTCEITGLLVGNAERGCEYRKDTELKACPFCGGRAKLKHRHIFGSAYSMIRCLSCGCQSAEIQANVGYCADEKATETWNRRAENDT